MLVLVLVLVLVVLVLARGRASVQAAAGRGPDRGGREPGPLRVAATGQSAAGIGPPGQEIAVDRRIGRLLLLRLRLLLLLTWVGMLPLNRFFESRRRRPTPSAG
ncbi:hypothetical protein [Streptomyces sp. MB09-01]|uniref:hypothetical protein n=1 Tax=Streptomyces sp. MB09-01 TaxID=3028666 RepID=UPI003A5C4B23